MPTDWQSGLFDFGSDNDFFWGSSRPGFAPKSPSGQTDKAASSGETDDAKEPLDVEFVSGPIGGDQDQDEETDDGGHPGPGFPFFPFGGNFGGFGGAFPFNFGPSSFKPWWKG